MSLMSQTTELSDFSRPVQAASSQRLRRRRVLYVSPQDMVVPNGMNQLQHQLLSALCNLYGDSVDLLSLGAKPDVARRWLQQSGLPITVLDGAFAFLARLNTLLWYGGGAVLCNKLRLINRFYFPLRTPLPRKWRDRYDLIVCYYAWGHRLLRLDRIADKVILDLGDVLADRHERIGARRWISMAAYDEKAILQSSRRCLAVSESDATEFERLYGIRPEVISFVPPESAELLQLASGDRPKRLGFIGAPSFGNEEVLRALAHPDFLRCLSEAGIELIIAGGICNTIEASVLQALERGGARILGRVPSILEYYRQISVTVNPVGPSTGIKIKSIETLVAGRGLITTQFGLDGSLAQEFPQQVMYIDWPIEPVKLGQMAVAAVEDSLVSDGSAATAYVEKWTQLLRELHTL